MFLEFYGLREQPFGVTPDPSYLYTGRSHSEALASIFYGIESDRGFMALIARPGMGKTTLIFRLLEQLRPVARTAFLFQTQCAPDDFMRCLFSDLGCNTSNVDLLSSRNELNNILLAEAKSNRRVVLFIDEAQNLPESVLETIRTLSNFETPQRKLFQIVLAGQPQLAELLARPELAQLRQRVSIISHLTPLEPPEVEDYIKHRLEVAGYAGGNLFTPNAIALIAKHSEGIPRTINNLCFNALSLGCAQKSRMIDTSIIHEVLSDLDLSKATAAASGNLRVRGSKFHFAAAFAVIALVGSLLFSLLGTSDWAKPKSVAPLAASAASIKPPDAALKSIAIANTPDPVQASVASAKQPEAMPEIVASSRKQSPIPEREIRSAEPGSEPTIMITVEPNETLARISQRYLKQKLNKQLCEAILRLNPQISNEDIILSGGKLRIPAPALRADTPESVLPGQMQTIEQEKKP